VLLPLTDLFSRLRTPADAAKHRGSGRRHDALSRSTCVKPRLTTRCSCGAQTDLATLPDAGFSVDVRETDKDITVHADLPGVKKDDVFVRPRLLTALSPHTGQHARKSFASEAHIALPALSSAGQHPTH